MYVTIPSGIRTTATRIEIIEMFRGVRLKKEGRSDSTSHHNFGTFAAVDEAGSAITSLSCSTIKVEF